MVSDGWYGSCERNILANDLACRGYHVRLRLDRAGAIAERLVLDATSDMVAHRHAGERGNRYCVNRTGPERREKIILTTFSSASCKQLSCRTALTTSVRFDPPPV